jgi:hypothetical protein
MQFNICLIQPKNYIHTYAFLELAQLLHFGIKSLNLRSKLSLNQICPDSTNIVIGAHLLDTSHISQLPKNSIILNTEQLDSINIAWLTPILQFAKNFSVWDYSLKNISKLNDLGFYKVKLQVVLKELIDTKTRFLKGVNSFLTKKHIYRDKGLLMYPPLNPGFAVFHSNPRNIAMFNSGTYHINITLPSMLGKKDETGLAPILYPELFKDQHKQFIRSIQWIEPFLIALYGTADPFSKLCPRYTKASQRCATSRYIGIGTYDTVLMTEGKILTVPIQEVKGYRTDFWWYKQYHTKSGYLPLDKIGMDINYKKHYNHGVELRIFDWFPEEKLKDLCTFLVYLADASLCLPLIPEACLSESWNDFVTSVINDGKHGQLSGAILGLYEKIFGIEFVGKHFTVETGFAYFFESIQRKYKTGFCAKCML